MIEKIETTTSDEVGLSCWILSEDCRIRRCALHKFRHNDSNASYHTGLKRVPPLS